MSIHHISDSVNLVIKISKAAPLSNIYFFLFILVKHIPYFLVTHDFNINSEMGISSYVRIISLSNIFTFFTRREIIFVIELVLVVFGIVYFVLWYYLTFQKQKYNRLSFTQKKMLSVISSSLFIFNFLDQYIFAMIIESLFCKTVNNDRNQFTNSTVNNSNPCHDIFYYIQICIGVILMIYILVTAITINILSSSSYFTSKGLFTASLRIIEYHFISCSLLQIVIQLEFHLSLNTMLIIKHVIRAFILLDYSILYYSHRWMYISYAYEYGLFWFKTICNVSIVIEWIFYFDIDNSLELLVKSSSMIIMKMIIELLISWLLVHIFIQQDHKQMVNFILTIATKPSLLAIQSANKVFYCIYHGKNETLFMKMLEAIQENYKNGIHSPQCTKNCLFCKDYSNYSIDLFQSQYLGFKEKFENNTRGQRKPLVIKSTFPFVYKMLEYIIYQNYERQNNFKREEYINALFLLVLFYLVFEENYYKSLFYIEQITKTTLYNKNWILKIQINQFQQHIFSEYRRQINKTEGGHNKTISNLSDSKKNHMTEMQLKYKSIEKIIQAENYFKQTIKAYSVLLSSFLSEDIPYNSFLQSVKQFKSCFDLTEASLPILMSGKECSVPYSSNKLDLFYSFFSSTHPSSIKNYNIFFNPNNLGINPDHYYYVIVISAHFNNNKMMFKLDYVSDQLITILKYTSEEFKHKRFEDLLSKTFIRPYCYLLEQSIREGDDAINISNFCLVDKDNYSLMFNFRGVTIFAQNTLKIFAKVEESKEQMTINLNKKNDKQKDRGKHKKKLNNICNYCFLFTNKHGKIVSICRDFESIFFLSSKTIKKYNINIKEILSIEQLNEEGTIEKHLSVIYNNIIDNNISKVGSIGEDEYSKQVEGIKEIHQMLKLQKSPVKVIVNYQEKKLIKGKGSYKKYYLFVISLENHEINELLLHSLVQESSLNIYLKNNMSKPHASLKLTNNTLTRTNPFKEILSLIRCFSYKYLYLRYGIKKSIDKNELQKNNKDYIETLINEKAFSNEEPSSISINDNKGINYLTKKQQIAKKKSLKVTPKNKHLPDVKFKYLPKFPKYKKWNKIITFVIPLICIITILALSLWKITIISLQRELFNSNGHFLMGRNIFNKVTATTLYMLFQSNNLQNSTIDNDAFNNSYQFYLSQIDKILSDFLVDYEFILNFFATNQKNIDPFFYQLLSNPINITIMPVDHKRTQTQSNFFNEHYLTIFLREIDESEPVIIYFNRTNGLYVDKSINYYAEAVYVRIIENQLTLIKAIYSELSNSFSDKLVDTWLKRQLNLTKEISIVSGLLLLYGILHFIYNLYQSKYLFAKYFISFVELRYFHLYLDSKTHLVHEYIINNGDKRDIKSLCQDITISSHQQETMQLRKTLSEISDNLHLFRVKAFYPKMNETRNENTTSIRGNSFIQSNFINNTMSQRSFNSGTMNSLISNQKRLRISTNQLNLNKEKSKKKDSIGVGNVSTTSYKAGNSTASSNVNILTNNTPQLLISRPIGDQNGKRLLQKPINFIIQFFVSLILLIIIFSINIVNVILSSSNLAFIKEIIKIEAETFNHINFSNELLLTYQISVLKNEELTYNYQSNGYLNHCNETLEINNNTIHNLFEELSSCYFVFSSKIENIITGEFSRSHNFESIKDYILSIDSEEFCSNYARSSEKNIKETNKGTYEDLLENCKEIGGGLNSKGLLNALNTMYITIVNLYKDFKNDLKRTSESNYERLNNKAIQAFQVEMVHVLFNLPFNYLKSFQKDFNEFESTSKQTEILIIVFQAMFFIILFIFLVASLVQMSIDETNIEFFEKCIINSILF